MHKEKWWIETNIIELKLQLEEMMQRAFKFYNYIII